MKKAFSVIMIALLVSFMVGCAANTHIIGDGAKGSEVVSAKQWYILCGLVPLNKVDTKAMAGDATNYEIKTQQSFIDVIISGITSCVTISCRSVSVKK
jgi:hypothetical protein